MEQPSRALSLWDVLAIAVNGIVGSGIFRLAGPLAMTAGAASILGVFGCGVLCVLLGLCFAELAGMFDRNGGPFLYAQAAFGRVAGFAVGWLCLFNAVVGYAVVAAGFGDELASAIPALEAPLFPSLLGSLSTKTLASLAVIALPALINVLGVKAGARTTDLLTAAKILPLVLLAVVGLLFVRPEVLVHLFSTPAKTGGDAPSFGAGLLSSAFLSVFLYSGFEFATVPSGEVRNARKDVGRALVLSVAACATLYAVLQAVTLSVVTEPQRLRGSPLVDAAVSVFGPVAAGVLRATALISMAGFCAGSALVAPRYFTAMAQARHVPESLAKLNGRGAPGIAVVCCALWAGVLVFFLRFGSLVDITNVSMLSQYVACTAAVVVLRYRQPDAPRAFRLPGGPFIPAAASLFALGLLVQGRPGGNEVVFTLGVVGSGFLVWGATAAVMRWRSVRPSH